MHAKKLIYEAPAIEKTQIYKRVDSGKGFLIQVPCQNCNHDNCSEENCDCFICRLYDDSTGIITIWEDE